MLIEPGQNIFVKGSYFNDHPVLQDVDLKCVVIDFEWVEGRKYMWVFSFLLQTSILIPA